MAILTATEVTILSDIACTAGTIIAGGFIPEVTNAINLLTNNDFTSDIYVQTSMTFVPSTRTIISNTDFDDMGFVDGDEIFIYGSYRNDGYKIIQKVFENTLVLATSESVVSELSGRSIMISLVSFPIGLKRIAAQMIAYNYDKRNKQSSGIKSHSLGPFSETFANTDSNGNGNGYPSSITDMLIPYRIARLI